jgi:hypothetical protein
VTSAALIVLGQAANNPGPLLLLAGWAAALGLLAAAYAFARKARLLSDLPTIPTRGVYIGLVELKGVPESQAPLVSRLASTPCVYYAWTAEERWSRMVTETYRDSNGKTRTRTRRESGWTTVARGGQSLSHFELRDDSGTVRIRPAGAKLETVAVFNRQCGRSDPLYYGAGPVHAVAHSDGVRRFRETALPLGLPLYVVGQAREREDRIEPEIAADPLAPIFLISSKGERSVTRRHRGAALACWLLASVPAAGGSAAFLAAGQGVALSPLQWSAIAAVWATVSVLAWSLLVYNGLVSLRNRVAKSWGLVEVQLKRRHDLIANLLPVVEAAAVHERQTQATVAQLRTQAAATAPGEPGPDPKPVAPALRALAESYPALKAGEAFLALQGSLSDTEERIALARGFFNEIATHYNTRLQQVPEGWLAALFGLQPRPLLAAEAFERRSVAVSFDLPEVLPAASEETTLLRAEGAQE